MNTWVQWQTRWRRRRESNYGIYDIMVKHRKAKQRVVETAAQPKSVVGSKFNNG